MITNLRKPLILLGHQTTLLQATPRQLVHVISHLELMIPVPSSI